MTVATDAERMVKLSVKDLVIGYLDKQNGHTMVAVDKVSLDIREGEFVTIVGLSGCGKSTFLNAIAGLVKHQHGEIRVNGRLVNGPGTDRAVVFQKASLLPWRKVGRNITYGLELGGMKPAEAREKASYYVNLYWFAVDTQYYLDGCRWCRTCGFQRRDRIHDVSCPSATTGGHGAGLHSCNRFNGICHEYLAGTNRALFSSLAQSGGVNKEYGYGCKQRGIETSRYGCPACTACRVVDHY